MLKKLGKFYMRFTVENIGIFASPLLQAKRRYTFEGKLFEIMEAVTWQKIKENRPSETCKHKYNDPCKTF